MNHERWRPVPEWEDLYEVSDQGSVRRLAPGHGIGAGYVLTPTRRGKGYTAVKLNREGQGTTYSVHILVMAAFVGPRPEGIQVNHRNGDKTDNRLSNLEYVTPKQNARHAIRNGFKDVLKGERHGMSKLTADQVRAIRASDETNRQLADKYGVAREHVWAIREGKKWTHL